MRDAATSESFRCFKLMITPGVLRFFATFKISFRRGTPCVTFLVEIPMYKDGGI